MSFELALIFFNVVTPVFAPVLFGYLATKPLQLEARSLTRTAYYLLVPAFTFNVMSTATLSAGEAMRMVLFGALVTVACAALAWGVGSLLRRSAPVIAAYVLVATFGNVGNFGFPLIEFGLGPEALPAATVYFLVILFVSFIVCVATANYVRGGSLAAIFAVFKTPALLALIPALIFNWLDWELPLIISRIVGLLAGAMIPVMLISLGVQMANSRGWKLSGDVVVASAVRLVGGAAVAFLLIGFFSLSDIARGTGILQASMPTAVLSSIIALEYDLEPNFVTNAVLFSTGASIVTLTVLLSLL